MLRWFRLLALGAAAIAIPLTATASAVVQSIKGQASARELPLARGLRILPGTTIDSAPGSEVVLRFDDGMQLALSGASQLTILDFRYGRAGEARVVLRLMKGALRVVTGRATARNPKEFFLQTPQAQFGVEGPADFTVALVNPAYLSVAYGSVIAANNYAVTTFSAGATASIASNAAAAEVIAASAFPATASSAIGNLAAVNLGGPAAGGMASGAALGGAAVPLPAAAAVGAAVAAGVIAAAARDKNPATATHH